MALSAGEFGHLAEQASSDEDLAQLVRGVLRVTGRPVWTVPFHKVGGGSGFSLDVTARA